MLHWWSDFRSRFDLLSPCETIIWNNHNIRVNGKHIFYSNYNRENIVLLSDVKFDLSNTESFNLAKRNGLKDSNFLTWTGVRCAVPSHLRIRSRKVMHLSLASPRGRPRADEGEYGDLMGTLQQISALVVGEMWGL